MAAAEKNIFIEKLVEEYADMLFGFAVSRTKDEGLAKDLVQETFVKAFEHMDQLKEVSHVKSWLFTVLRNKLIDHYRSLAARMNKKTVELDYSVYFDQSELWQGDKVPGDWLATYDVKKEEDFNRLKSTLEECIDHLKEMPAAVIKLKYMEEVNSGEICKLLNISSSNYWVIIHRAKLKLRDCMEKMLP